MSRSVEQRYEDYKTQSRRRDIYFCLWFIVLLATAAWVSLWLWQFSPLLIIFPIAVSGLLILLIGAAFSAEEWDAIECDMELEEFIKRHPIWGLAEICRNITPAKIRPFFSPTQSMTGFFKMTLGGTLTIILGSVLGKFLDDILSLKPGTILIYVIGPFLFVLFGCLVFIAYQKTKKLRNKLAMTSLIFDGP